MRIICQTVRRIANEILGIKGLLQVFQNRVIMQIDKCAYTCSKIQKTLILGDKNGLMLCRRFFLVLCV